jgi:hypothetical protein
MGALIIDGDIIAHRAGFATDKTKYLVQHWGGGIEEHLDSRAAKEAVAASTGGIIWSRREAEPESTALLLVDTMIGEIRDRYASENLSMCIALSGVGNWRHSVATRATYKGNRDGSVRPTHMRAIRQHLINKGAMVSQGEEADDFMGIWATDYPGSIICSNDKDMLQIPGRHFNFVTKEEITVSPKEACLNFYTQVIAGDTTDNIPGCQGYGAIKARKMLEECTSPYECWKTALAVYDETYEETYQRHWGFEYAFETAQLVFIRRHPGEMWHAPEAPKA